MRGKLIVVEGTDCSGKETQTKLLQENLRKENIKCEIFSFPCYDTPTGKIVGGPYLGKSYICEGWFKEGAPNVDSRVSSLYYAADRLYNINKIIAKLDEGINVILDRYVYSNMAHQGGKYKTKEERIEMYEWLENLEFNFLGLPKPEIKLFLHMPFDVSLKLKQNRKEALDENERDKNHLLCAENAYIEVSDKYNFYTVECNFGLEPKSIEEIQDEVFDFVLGELKKN